MWFRLRYCQYLVPVLAFPQWPSTSVTEQLQGCGHVAGMSRLSCSFCILASRADLRRAAPLRSRLYRTSIALERRIGHTLSPTRRPLPEVTGVPPGARGDLEDLASLGGA